MLFKAGIGYSSLPWVAASRIPLQVFLIMGIIIGGGVLAGAVVYIVLSRKQKKERTRYYRTGNAGGLSTYRHRQAATTAPRPRGSYATGASVNPALLALEEEPRRQQPRPSPPQAPGYGQPWYPPPPPPQPYTQGQTPHAQRTFPQSKPPEKLTPPAQRPRTQQPSGQKAGNEKLASLFKELSAQLEKSSEQPVAQTPRPQPAARPLVQIPEEYRRMLENISKDVREVKNYLQELTRNLEKISVGSVTHATSTAVTPRLYTLAPVKDIRDLARRLSLDEVVVFTDNGLPVESYPRPVEEKRTGAFLEIYRLAEEYLGGRVKRVQVLLPTGTVNIYKVTINDKNFYVAYRCRPSLRDARTDPYSILIESFVRKRIKDLIK